MKSLNPGHTIRMQIWLDTDRRKNVSCLCKTANNEIDWVETMLRADNVGQFGTENLTNVAPRVGC